MQHAHPQVRPPASLWGGPDFILLNEQAAISSSVGTIVSILLLARAQGGTKGVCFDHIPSNKALERPDFVALSGFLSVER